MFHRFSRLGLLVFAGLLSPLAARADLTWGADGSGGAGTWDTTTLNWYDGTSAVAWPASSYPYTGAESAIFAGTGGMVTLGSTVAASHLTFYSPGYTIAGSFLHSPAGGLTVTSNADATITTSVFGSTGGTFTKDGTGALSVSNLAFFASINVQAGELIAQAFASLPSTAILSMANAPGVYLTLAPATTTFLGGLSGGGADGGIIRASSGAGTSTLSISGAGGTFSGQLQDNGSGKLALSVSSGAQVLTTAITYSGATTVSGGTLALRDLGTITNSAATLSGGTLLLDNSGQLQGDRLSDSAALTLRGGSLVLQGAARRKRPSGPCKRPPASAPYRSIPRQRNPAALFSPASAAERDPSSSKVIISARSRARAWRISLSPRLPRSSAAAVRTDRRH